ncbi:MAG: hypothetical protein PUB12_00980 [[Clostridium] aminophilum]|uniref:hypothetical protein n=1 Tax=[Clostridium] aminophilum TaxID=1526 RepID=UPI0026E9E573|nr:hypothetical protein [[Clostridium] aminophilum]MDD6195465.1 hypothetical protein [[Clostridium] aminophilum]
MERAELLNKNAMLARTGDRSGYENIYILTVGETYGKVHSLQLEPRDEEVLIEEVYVSLYRHVHELPLTEEDLSGAIEDEIYRSAGRIFGDEVADRVINGSPVEMPDNTAATIWMRIEDAAGIRNDEDEGEADWKIWAVIALKVFGTFLMLVLIASVIWYIWEHATRI